MKKNILLAGLEGISNADKERFQLAVPEADFSYSDSISGTISTAMYGDMWPHHLPKDYWDVLTTPLSWTRFIGHNPELRRAGFRILDEVQSQGLIIPHIILLIEKGYCPSPIPELCYLEKGPSPYLPEVEERLHRGQLSSYIVEELVSSGDERHSEFFRYTKNGSGVIRDPLGHHPTSYDALREHLHQQFGAD